MILLLSLLHLIGDFYLQTKRIAACKVGHFSCDCSKYNCSDCKNGISINLKYFFLHIILYIVPFFILFFFIDWPLAIAIIAILFGTHLIIDLCFCYLKRLKAFYYSLIFFIDQILHFAILFLILYLFKDNFYNIDFIYNNYKYFIFVLMIIVLLIPSSVLIDILFKDIFVDKSYDYEINHTNKEMVKKFDVGIVIGIIERLLIFVFFLLKAYASIALIITLKTWARSKDLKEEDFRNKYLVGTLASFLIASCIGIGTLFVLGMF